FVRSLIDGGFADLHHPEYWDLDFLRHSPSKEAYEKVVHSISESLDFFEAASGQPIHESTTTRFYTSHEALHLLLEQAQTRYIPRSQRWYNLSTHMPWIGMRTAALDGAHVEFFRGIANPLGVKVGPSMSAEWVQGLIATLNPNNEPGRIVLIHRMGAKDIEKRLPPLIQAVRATGSPVLWICDPMHGNTETATSGLKTRRFENIVSELESAFRIHRELGSWLGGVHFELTGEDVTECTGGARGLTDADLARAYKSQVDPRLNYEQALELAMRIAGLHAKKGAQKSATINI
ncbi:MAG TPA: 3-deoxy-7-phosphoheptulonate synthase, partial [Steroidobacter sp.]|nr:3-deoxy-7-phosphoheptulonate synthase [Steroidobacter sp.]